jgi:hypothetical protein
VGGSHQISGSSMRTQAEGQNMESRVSDRGLVLEINSDAVVSESSGELNNE